MSALLPPPVPLDLPPEEPAALERLAAGVTSAAFHLGLLAGHLAGPAASVRGWLGRDAAAAAAQVAALAGLVRDERAAVTAAAARLESHASAVRDTVARVRALRAAQREEFGAAVRRVVELGADPAVLAPSPAAVAVAEDWRAADTRRGQAHAVLLAELAEDAAATARVLAACTAVVGGTGTPGDDGRVLRHLAQVLPGWGDPELAGRGRALADALSGPLPAGRVDDLAREAADWAGVPAYADALLAGLGPAGLRWVLALAGEDTRGAAAPLAVALAGALGAARAGGPGADPGGVLTARAVGPADPDGAADVVLLGMAAVLAAGLRSAGGGPPPTVLTSWGAQALARERAQQATAGERVPRAVATGDGPVELVVRLLVRAGDPVAAARLLAAPDAFAALLARRWWTGPADLTGLVRLAASAPGAAGDAAARAGLVALGEGLAPGAAGSWTVRPATAAAVTPELARVLAAHPDVVTGLLGTAATAGPPLSAPTGTALRGLGWLTRDAATAGALAEALAERLRDPAGPSGAAAAALGAFVAVQQYGHRLEHALAAATARSHAIDRAVWYAVLLSPLRAAEQLDRFTPQLQTAVDLAVDTVGHLFGSDGSWTVGADRGAVLTRGTAAARAAAAAGAAATGGEAARDAAAVEAAATAYDVALRRLGLPTGPTPEPWSWLRMVADDLPDPTAFAELEKARIDTLRRLRDHPSGVPHLSPDR